MTLESRTGTHAAAYALLALGFVGLSWTSMVAGNFRAILLLACAVTCGYIYQVWRIISKFMVICEESNRKLFF